MNRRRRKFRLKKSFKGFLILVLITVLFILKNKGIFDLSKIGQFFGPREKELSLMNAIQLDENTKDIHIYSDYIVQWLDNRLIFLDKDGLLVKEREFDFEDPLISYSDQYIYIINRKDGHIYTINDNCKAVRETKLNKEVYNVKESNGKLIFHRKIEDSEEVIILNEDGFKEGEFLYENKNILSYISSPNSSQRVMASLLMEPKLTSVIDIYNTDNTIIKTLNIDNEIVIFLDYLKDGSLIVLTDNGLYAIENEEIIWSSEFNLVHDIYISDDIIYVLHNNEISSVDSKGRVKKILSFDGNYTDLIAYKDGLILYGETELGLVKKNKQILSHKDKIRGIYTDESNIFIWTPSRLNEYELIDK